MRPHLLALALLVAPLALTAPAFAAEPAKAPAEPAKAVADIKPTLAGGVNVAQLRKMFDDLGHKTQEETGGETPYFSFEVEAEGVTVVVVVEISGSSEYIWLKSPFRDITDKDDFRKLLGANFQVQPAQFYLTDDKLLWMAVPIENRSVKPADVERALDVLVDGVSTTVDLWDEPKK